MKRRKFIAKGSRWFLLSGLLGSTALLIYRRQFGDPQNCFQNPFCKSCNKFNSCSILADLNSIQDERQKGK